MKTTKGVSPTTGATFSIEEHADLSSVEVNVNAKGEATVSVKVYAETPSKASTEAVTVLADTIRSLVKRNIPVAGNPQIV